MEKSQVKQKQDISGLPKKRTQNENMSLKKSLVAYLAQSNQWTPKGHLTDRMQWFKKSRVVYLAETVGRALRDAETEKQIAVKDDGISVQYKYLPENIRDRYICSSDRTDKNVLFKK